MKLDNLPSKKNFMISRVLLCFFSILFFSSPVYSAISTVASEQSGTTIGVINHVGTGTFGSRNNNCGNITPSVPAGSVGDLLIAVAVIRENTTNVTMPGWTQYYSGYHGVNGNQDVGGYIFWRVATGGDPSTITSTSTGAPVNCRSLRGQISRFDGVDVSAMPGSAFETNPIAAGNSSTQNTGNVTTGTETTTSATAMSIVATFINDNAVVTEADGFSESFDSASAGGRDSAISLNYRQEASAGAKGAFTWAQTLGTDESIGVLFALTPDNTLEGISINVPVGTTTDDVMLAAIAVGPSTTTITAPSGWTLLNRVDQGTATSNSQAIYYRVATSTEPTAYVWTFSGGAINGTAGGIITYRGVDTASPIDASGGNTTVSGTSHQANSINTTVANTMIVSIHSFSSSEAWTPPVTPAGMTEQIDIASLATPNANGVSLEMNDVLQGAIGATGNITATVAGNADTGVAQLVALTPTVISGGITVNFAGGNMRRIIAGSISLTDAALGTPEASATSVNVANSAGITTNISTLTNNAWLVDTVSKARGAHSYTPGASQTERWDNTLGNNNNGSTGAMSTKAVATAGATSMTQTHTSATRLNAHAVISVAPATSSSTITFDAVASNSVSNANSINWTHSLVTSSTFNTKLIVGVTFEDPGACGGESVSSVTYGSLSLIQAAATSVFVNNRCQYAELWYIDLNDIIVSTNNNSTLGGQAIDQDEAVEYDVVSDTGTLFFDDLTFNANERLTGLHQYTNGNVALSTATDANIGGNAFQDDDIVEVTPSGTAGIYDFVQVLFDGGTHFTAANERIDAVYVRNNGNIILSTIAPAQLPLCGGGNLNFQDDDLVEWFPNATTPCATMFLDESATTDLIPNAAGDEDIDGVHLLNDDSNLILFSLLSNNTIRGTAVLDGDVVLYNRNTDTASIFFSESNFTSGGEDIDALTLAVPPFTPPLVDHYAISYPLGTPGVTCEALAVRITAHGDATDHSITVAPSNTTQITLSTSPMANGWTLKSGNGTFTPPDKYTFDGTETFVEFWLTETTATTVPHININITDGTATDIDGDLTEDVNAEFADAVFRFFAAGTGENIGTQIAGKESDIAPGNQTIQLRSVVTNTSTMACESRILNTTTIKMAYKCNNPTTCQAAPRVQIQNAAASTFDINPGNDNAATVDAMNGSYNNVDLDFGITGTATFSFDFSDVGQVQLFAREILAASPPDPAITVFGASNMFIVRPFGFDVQVTANPAATSAAGVKFTGAGEDFTTTVRAVAWNATGDDGIPIGTANDGIPDGHESGDTDPSNNTDLSSTLSFPTTPNYGQEGTNEATDEDINLSALLDQPSGVGVNDPGLSGGTSITTIAAGSGNSSTVNYDEVGIIEITAQVAVDNNYLGAGAVIGKSGYVGRFVPYVFEATTPIPAEFGAACGTFSYIGQGFTYTTAPVINLTAKAKGIAPAFGSTTQNYTGTFFKLTDAKLLAVGNKTYAAASGSLDTSLLPSPDPVIADLGSGNATLTFSDGGGITFNRGNPQNPFDADIALSLNVLDEDDAFAGNGSGVNQNPVSFGAATAGNGIAFTGGNKEQRWGRLILDNAFGSELLPLEIPVRAEYQSSGEFITNTADGCTAYTSANISFSNHSGITAGPNLTATGTGMLMSGATDPANPLVISNSLPEIGSVDVTHAIDFWLQFDWNNDTNHINDPISRATWGVFAGPDEFIYIREPW